MIMSGTGSKQQEQMAPFYRNGKARPLTAQDYANIARIPRTTAAMRLSGMVKKGVLIATGDKKNCPTIYEVA